jgi:uncharacterized membrane protein YfcA
MDLALWEYAALILAGILAGFINVMAGGGSIITVPIMMFLGVPGPVANGTNRLPIVAQNISACLTYLRHGVPELRLVLSLALCAVPGAIAGALLGVTISVEAFNIVLAGVMALVLILIMTNAGSQESNVTLKPSRKRLLAGHGLMVLAGFWGGFIQIGMGFILLPILHRVLGLSLVTANIHKVFIILLYTLSALFVFGNQLELLWWIGGVMAGGQWRGRLVRGEAHALRRRASDSRPTHYCYRGHDREADMVHLITVVRSIKSMMNTMMSWTLFLQRGALGLLSMGLLACTTMQVDTMPTDRFAAKGYDSFSWKSDIPTGMSGSLDGFYQLSSTIRDAVMSELDKKGYRYEESGGDFVVSYELRAALEEGTAEPAPDFSATTAVINRNPDQAIVDNTYALSGPREIASLVLLFEDGINLAPTWSASVSQVVENRNQPDLEKVRRKLERGLAKAFRQLPDVKSR